MSFLDIKYILIVFFGILFVGLALYKIYSMLFSSLYDKSSVARVINIDIKIKRINSKYCIMDVVYKTETGDIINGKVDDMFYPSPYKIGDLIKVKYKSIDPSVFIVQDYRQLYLYVIFGIVGISIIFLGLFNLL